MRKILGLILVISVLFVQAITPMDDSLGHDFIISCEECLFHEGYDYSLSPIMHNAQTIYGAYLLLKKDNADYESIDSQLYKLFAYIIALITCEQKCHLKNSSVEMFDCYAQVESLDIMSKALSDFNSEILFVDWKSFIHCLDKLLVKNLYSTVRDNAQKKNKRDVWSESSVALENVDNILDQLRLSIKDNALCDVINTALIKVRALKELIVLTDQNCAHGF